MTKTISAGGGATVVMSRFELKYVLTPEQVDFFRPRLERHMQVDQYGLTSIASLYYDTQDGRLIRQSMEKPPFKEKIRLRSYGLATDVSPVFLELKRKADGVVYKRRIQTTVPAAEAFFNREHNLDDAGQIGREITYFRDYYRELVPSCLIIYDRTAYVEPDSTLRLTIDDDPRYRTEALDLRVSMEGISLLPPGYAVLEVKVQEAVPLWLAALLDEGAIYKTSFSKYGEAIQRQRTIAVPPVGYHEHERGMHYV